MKKFVYGKRSQGGLYVLLAVGILAFLYWLSPDMVVWIGNTLGEIITWVVTTVIGIMGSLITGFAPSGMDRWEYKLLGDITKEEFIHRLNDYAKKNFKKSLFPNLVIDRRQKALF